MRPFLPSFTILSAPGRTILSWLIGQSHALPPAISQEFDAALLAEMRRHRLTPVIFEQIKRQGLERTLDPQWLEFLQHDYYVSLQTALRQENDALQVLQALAAAGIEVFLLKGADLRLRLYDDPAVRPMVDLDLLVSPASLGAVREFLGILGYTLSLDSVNPRPGFRERYRVGLHFQAPPPASLMVDLHWGLEAVAGYYRLPFTRLAEQAHTLDWEGLPVKVLSPEHAFMHLCLHNYDEGDAALRLLDLGLTLTRLPINWQLFLTEAGQCRCQAPLFVMLRGLGELLPGAVPLQVLRGLEAYVPWGAERLVLRHSYHPLARLLGPLSHQRRPSAWAAYLAALLWPDPAYLTAVSGSPSRLAYLASSLKYLFSRRGSQ